MAATAYELLAFVVFAAITLGSSLGVVLVRDVWHAALLLGVSLLSVAVHFVMLQAEFLAAMQVLVYVGGVLVLISFAVMLVRRREVTRPDLSTHPELNLGTHLVRGTGAVALFVVLAWVVVRTTFGDPTGFPADGSVTATIGYAIVGLESLAVHRTESFLAVLIMTGFLLDAALEGAVMLARRDDREPSAGGVRSDGGERR